MNKDTDTENEKAGQEASVAADGVRNAEAGNIPGAESPGSRMLAFVRQALRAVEIFSNCGAPQGRQKA